MSDNIRYANSISVHVCEHGTVYVRLHDQFGVIFAVAPMESNVGLLLAEQLVDQIEAFENGDTIGECAGHG